MKWLRALMARLRPEPIAFPYPSAVTAVARVGASTEVCEAEWRTALEVTRIAPCILGKRTAKGVA